MRFFQLTIGRVLPGYKAFFSVLKAISAFGNLVVVTFVAARVKQEIAKEGILPYSLVFAENYDFSLRRLFANKSAAHPKPTHQNPIDYTSHIEKTPVATIALHWFFTNLMVVIPVLALQPTPYSTSPAFTFLAGSYAYLINIVTFTFISLGLMFLRFSPSTRWAQKSAFGASVISPLAAGIVFVACLFPMICIWVPDPAVRSLARTAGLVPWYGATGLGLGLLGFAFLYWVVFRLYVKIRSAREGTTLRVMREPKFKVEANGDLTQVLEIVTLQWVREVGELRIEDLDGRGDGTCTTSSMQGGWGQGQQRPMSEAARFPPPQSPGKSAMELPVQVHRGRSGARSRHELE